MIYIPCSSESSCTVNAHTCDNDECYDNESSFVDQDDCCGNEDIDFQYAVKPSLDAQTFKAHTIKFVCDNIELPLIQNIFIILARIQLLNIDDIDQDEIIAALTQEDIAHLNAFYQALDKQLTEQA